MSSPLSLEVTEKAARQIEDAADWWPRNRPKSPDAVYEELVRAFEFVTRQPAAGASHLYYHVASDPHRLVVLALWHDSRLPAHHFSPRSPRTAYQSAKEHTPIPRAWRTTRRWPK